MLAVLHKHPHDSLELDGAEHRFPFIAVGLECQFLRPPGELVGPDVGRVGDGFSHVFEDSGHYVPCFGRHDHADENVLERFKVCSSLIAGAFPFQENYVGAVG